MSSFYRIAVLLAAPLLFPLQAHAEAYGSGFYGELQLGISHEDNISRSFLSVDEVSDEVGYIYLGGGHSQKVGNNAQLVLYGYLAYNIHNEYGDLDNIAITAGGTYTWQPNPSYDSVWFIGDVRATVLNYDNSPEREGTLFQGDLSVNKRLGTRTTGHLGYRYSDLVFLGKTQAEEDNDAAFDTATHEGYVGLDYQLTRTVSLYGEYAFRRGGVWSNVSFEAGIVEYDAETIDPVFDDCAPDDFRCQPRYAGRTEADIHRLNIGVVFPIRSVDIDISAVYYDAKGDNDRDYKDWYISAGLIWNF